MAPVLQLHPPPNDKGATVTQYFPPLNILATFTTRSRNLDSLNREQRTVLQKASKAVVNLTATHALLETSNRQLQVQLEELQAKKVKKIAADPNTLFANVETIKRAMDETATREKERGTDIGGGEEGAGSRGRSAENLPCT